MSWLIAELGNLKDNGLGVEMVKEALQNTASLADTAAYAKAYAVLGQTQVPLDGLISKSQNVLKTYFDEEHLKGLLVNWKLRILDSKFASHSFILLPIFPNKNGLHAHNVRTVFIFEKKTPSPHFFFTNYQRP